MSISVQVYRARIGSFNVKSLQNNRCKVSFNKLKTKKIVHKHFKMIASLKTVLLLICIPMGYTIITEATES